MAGRIEDYAIIGDMETAALVGRDGSIDWLCMPRFDSPAFFAGLLGTEDNGHWSVRPVGAGTCTRRSYRGDSLVLDTEWDLPGGTLRVTDFMPPRDGLPDVVRVVECTSGRVEVESVVRLRFDYGSVVPWVRRIGEDLHAIAGPDSVWLHGSVRHQGRPDMSSYARFSLAAGEQASFVLTWHPSHAPEPPVTDGLGQLEPTLRFWDYWMRDCTYDGPYGDAVRRSLLTLKALTYEPTGGIVAAATTSLPEHIGGVRNWDYRFCWLRDATLTLQALIRSGFLDEAADWREWLLRAVAGDPADLQIMYGVAGERRLPELELDWLPGYEGSRPVRVGNAAAEQLQLDVYGEVMDALAVARAAGLSHDQDAWHIQRQLLDFLEGGWRSPDEGLWEVRGARRHFTHSKILAWSAFDVAVNAVRRHGLPGPVERWTAIRDEIHRDVCDNAWNEEKQAFTQSYGSSELDAAVLLMPQVGFLPPEDPRVRSTVDAIDRELRVEGGLVLRYRVEGADDGLPGDEGAFLVCSFWLVDALHMTGREDRAREFFEHLLSLRNDVGLLAEEYDPRLARQVGNVPQAFSHVGLVNSAHNLETGCVPRDRATEDERAVGGTA